MFTFESADLINQNHCKGTQKCEAILNLQKNDNVSLLLVLTTDNLHILQMFHSYIHFLCLNNIFFTF